MITSFRININMLNKKFYNILTNPLWGWTFAMDRVTVLTYLNVITLIYELSCFYYFFLLLAYILYFYVILYLIFLLIWNDMILYKIKFKISSIIYFN